MDQQTQPGSPVPPTAAPSNVSPAASSKDSSSNVPNKWPGAFGAYKYSKKAVKTNLGTLVILYIIILLINFINNANYINSSSTHPPQYGILQLILGLALTLVGIAQIITYIAGVRGKEISLGSSFSKAMPLWLKMIGLSILLGFSAAGSLLLLIIPFFIIMPRLVLAPYFLIDKNSGIGEAFKSSWRETKGHAGKVWGIIGVSILMILPVITIIGALLSIYFLFMYSAALAILYETIIKSRSSARA